MEEELVQYYIVNSELDMSMGKIAAQVAHVATIIVVENCEYDHPDNIGYEKSCIKANKFWKWYDNNQKKIILRGRQKDLERLVEQGFYFIKDNGLTEIPVGSLTCVGLGVMLKSEAQKYIKRLQLL
jgi:peptidyl-tRNA hydrolase